jgi:hypothetical protein
MLQKDIIRLGLIAAGLVNIGGVLFFSTLFTNTSLNAADPVLMGNVGLLLIMLWGLVYIASAAIFNGGSLKCTGQVDMPNSVNIKWLAAIFVCEKLVYVASWLIWLGNNSLAALYQQDILAGIFYTIYGPNDALFMLFFAWVFWVLHKKH